MYGATQNDSPVFPLESVVTLCTRSYIFIHTYDTLDITESESRAVPCLLVFTRFESRAPPAATRRRVGRVLEQARDPDWIEMIWTAAYSPSYPCVNPPIAWHCKPHSYYSSLVRLNGRDKARSY